MSCKNCYWKTLNLAENKVWSCKFKRDKKFNYPALHGWFCPNKMTEEEMNTAVRHLFRH